MCALAHGNRFFFFLFFPICGFFFLFAENANKRKTRFSIEGTSLLQYEDINWIGWIPHAVVSKVLWQLTERHLETQELGFVWRNFPTRVMSKGKWMWEKGEGSWGGVQKEKRKECHWWGRKWKTASVSSFYLLLFLPVDQWLQPPEWEQSLLLVASMILFGLHFCWTVPFHFFHYYILVSHSILHMLLSLRNEDCLLRTGPVFFTDVMQFLAEKPIFPEHSTVVNLWFPLEPGPFPSSPPPRKWEFSCHCRWWLTHLDPHRMNAVQNLLLMTCQGDPYSQEVSRREKNTKKGMLVLEQLFKDQTAS